MIRKLSLQRFVLLFCLLLGFSSLRANPTTITTVYPSGAGIVGPSAPVQFITFTVSNNSDTPIAITGIGDFHIHTATTNPPTVYTWSQDNATYSLWYGDISGPAAASNSNIAPRPAGNWTLAGSGPNIISAGNGIIDVIPQELTPSGRPRQLAIICPRTTVKFALVCPDTFLVAANPTPGAFSDPSGRVTLTTAGGTFGVFPGSATYNTAPNTVGFWGSITFDWAYPMAPVLTATPNPVCNGANVTLTAKDTLCTATNHPIFHWIGPGVAPGTTGNTLTLPVNATSTFKCYIEDTSITLATSPDLKSDTSSIVVTVIPNTPPTVTGKTHFCYNEQFNPVTVNTTGQVNWYYNATGGSPLPANSATVNTTLGTQVDTYYVSQNINGCESGRTMVIYTVAPQPAPPVVTSPIFYCANTASVPLNASGQQLLWYYSATGGVPSTIVPLPPTTVGDTFDYYVTQQNMGCESPRAHVKVLVVYRSNGLILSSVNELCQGVVDTFTYYGSAFADAAYNWAIPNGATFVSGGKQGPFVVRFDSSGIHTVTLQVGNTGCYSDKYTSSITVDSVPNATISVMPDLCEGRTELFSLSYYDRSIDTFSWDFGEGASTTHFATDQGPYGVVYSSPGKKFIALHIVDAKCGNMVYDTVMVHQYPDAGILIDKFNAANLYCEGDSLHFSAHYVDAAAKYMWTPTRFFGEFNNLPDLYGRVDFNGYVTLNVTDQYGCKNSDSILVKTQPCCNMVFPSAFSPNGDGKNDLFRKINDANNDIKSFHIANRWGVTVFESANAKAGWDGTFNGTPQDIGTYYYFVSFMCNGKMVTEKGELTLIR